MPLLAQLTRGLARIAHGFEAMLGLHPSAASSSEDATPTTDDAPRAVDATVAARAGSPAHAEAIRSIAADVTRYWQELTGQPIQPQELELVLALFGLETVWGLGWRDKSSAGAGDMRNSHNFNARQYSGAGNAWVRVEYGDTRPPTEAEVAAGQTANIPIDAPFNFYIDAEGRTAAQNGAFYAVRDLTKVWDAREALRTGRAAAFAHRLGPDRANGGLGYYGGFGTTMAAREGGYANALASRLPEVVAALGYDRSHATVATAEGAYANTATGQTNDPRLGGVVEDIGAWLHGEWADLERWLGFRAANDTGPSSRSSASSPASAELTDRRRQALAIVAEVVPATYGDERFTKLSPNLRTETADDGSAVAYLGDQRLPAGFTNCGDLPGFLGSRLKLERNLSSYGTEGLRTNARAFGAWVEPGDGRLPQPGDAYAIEGPSGGIVHVGIVIDAPASGAWRTADAGQGTRLVPETRYVERPYDAAAGTLGGPMGPRKLAGWANLDLVPAAAHPLAGLVKDAA